MKHKRSCEINGLWWTTVTAVVLESKRSLPSCKSNGKKKYQLLFIILSYSDLVYSVVLFAKFKGFGYVQLNWKRSCVESLWPLRKINSILSSSLSSLPRRLICHDARAQQFQLSAVGTMISVWRAAHNRFIKVAAARHSLAATRLAVIVMLAIEKRKKKKRKKGRKRKDRKKDGESPEKED